MQAVLIDTNVWTGLLDEKDGANTLAALESLFAQQTFVLLLPTPIPEEWERHYQSRIPSLKSEVRDQLRPISKGLLDVVELAHSNLAQATLELAQRIERVFKNALPISTSDEVRVEAMKRFEARPRQAPFHNNLSSHDDARLYLSSAEWCLHNGVDLLHFVTNNHKDFADNVRTYSGIHPDLIRPGLTVKYYGSLKNLLAVINPSYEAVRELTRVVTSKKPLRPIALDASKSLLEQWRECWQYCFNQLPNIPKSLLSRLFPIRTSDYESTGYHGTTIDTDNQSLVETLRTHGIHSPVRYGEGGKKRPLYTAELTLPDDLHFVLQQLNRSLVNTIHWHKEHEDFDVHIGREPECECVRCLCERLDFARMFKILLHEPSNDVDENMKNGYVHFKLGNYLKAFRFFKHAYRQTRKKGLCVQHLICAQNLVEIESIIEWLYSHQERGSHKSFRVNTDEIFWANLHRDDFVRESSRLVYLNYFFDDAYYRISKFHQDLSQQYDSQLSGGWSSNQNLYQLRLTAGELGNFITHNSIVSHYSHARFEELYKLVVETYFRCHAFNEHQSSRIDAFDDGLLLELASNSSAKVIRDKLWHVHDKRLRYRKRAGQPSAFVERTIFFVRGLTNLSQIMEQHGEAHFGPTLEKVWTRITGNFLTIASVLELSQRDAKQIADALVETLSSVPSVQNVFREVDGIKGFVLNKRRAFGIGQLKAVTAALTSSLDKHKVTDFFEALGDLFRTHYPQAVSNDRAFSRRLTEAIVGSSTSDDLSDRTGIICEWYASLHQCDKETIRNRVEEILTGRFSRNLYYHCALYGVVDYQKWLDEYVRHVAPPDSQHPRLFGGTGYSTSHSLSELCNLAFKWNIDTTSALFDRFRGQSDYYDWLLDMDNFDYRRFNENWTVEYRTSAYLKKIFSNPACRKAVQAKLQKNLQPKIAEYFVKYS